jgi:Domain of unknown function (DUF397)
MEDNELARATWRTATYTQGNGACVEVAGLGGGRVAVRDTRDRTGPAIVITADQWRTFLASTQKCELA